MMKHLSIFLLASVLYLPLLVLADKYDNAFFIQNVKSKLVIEVQNCKKVNAANLMSAKKRHYQSENVDCQLFTYDAQKQQLISLLDGQGTFVIDISGGVGGNHVIVWPSHDGANQKWALEGESMTCKAANKLITEKGVNQIIGAAAATNADNQKFVRVPFVKDLYYIINPIGKQLLTVESADNGTPVKTIAYPHKDIKSYWRTDKNTTFVRNVFSGRALDLAGGCNGNLAHTWLLHGQANQQWKFDDKTGLLSTCNKVLSIKEEKFANGGTIALLPKNNSLTDYQRWFKLPVTAGEEEITKLLTLIKDSKGTVVVPAAPIAGLARTDAVASQNKAAASEATAATTVSGGTATLVVSTNKTTTATESGGQATILSGATKASNATGVVEEIVDCKPEDEVVPAAPAVAAAVTPASNSTAIVKPTIVPVVPPAKPSANPSAAKHIGKCCPCPS